MTVLVVTCQSVRYQCCQNELCEADQPLPDGEITEYDIDNCGFDFDVFRWKCDPVVGVTGDCGIQSTDNNCVVHLGYPGVSHGDNESCSISIFQDGFLVVELYQEIQTGYDGLFNDQTGLELTENVEYVVSSGDTFTWISDGSVSHGLWKVCFTPDNTLIPTVEPSTSNPTMEPSIQPSCCGVIKVSVFEENQNSRT
eukprot:UN03254